MNAQDPSAMAVIDTERDEIIRLFETGPLPKMVAVSPDGTRLAVTHWGDNTVGLMDISSDRPEDWHYLENIVVDYQLKAELSDEDTVYWIDWDLLFYESDAMQKATFKYENEFAQLIVKDGDLTENWQAWVNSKMPLVQRVLDELNAMND